MDSPAEEQDRDTDETNINDVIESIELTPTQDVAEVLPITKQTHIKGKKCNRLFLLYTYIVDFSAYCFVFILCLP